MGQVDAGRAIAFREDVKREFADDPTVFVWVTARPDGRVTLEQLWSEVERGVGHGRRAMETILRLADEHEVELVGIPHWLAYETEHLEDEAKADRLDALNEKKLDNDQLLAWYQRLGFVLTGEMEGDDPVIARPPSPVASLAAGPC